MRTILYLTLLVLLSAQSTLRAQVRMESLTVADGLSQGFVNSFIQDEKGFIWMGTFDGLNRYDGYAIRHFKPKPFDSLSIQASYISCLYEDKQHFIWVGTSEGLYLFDPLKEQFFRISNPRYTLPAYFISNITGDKDGNIFVQITLDSDPLGLFRVRLPAHFSMPPAGHSDLLAAIQIQRIVSTESLEGSPQLLECIGDTMILLRDSQANLLRYSYAQNRLYRFNLSLLPRCNTLDHSILWGKYKGYIFRTLLPDGRDYLLPLNHWIMALRMEGGRVGAWFYAGNSFYRIVGNTPLVGKLDLPPEELARQDFFSQRFETLLATEKPPSIELSLWNNNLLVDKGGVVWLGTGGWGVRKINPRQISFKKFVSGSSVSSIRELPDGHLWVRLYNDHSVILNPSTGQIDAQPWNSVIIGQWLYELFISKENDYWGLEPWSQQYKNNRLILYEKKSGIVTRFQESIPFLEGVPEKIMEDRAGNIWIAAHKGLLFRCKPGMHTLDHFSYAHLMPGDNRQVIRCTSIVQDADGVLWIGTNGGLVRVDNASGDSPRFSLFKHDPANPKSLSMDWLTSICPDPADRNILWIGTRGGGLNRFQISTQTFSFFTESPNGFPDNVVYGILPDNQGNLWCSTNRGICRYSPVENTVITYQESDGLSSTEFNTNSFLRTKDGRLWFGGVSGLNAFKPEEILPQSTPPPVAITGIKVRGELRYPGEEGFLSLPFEENNVLLEYAALDFASPATNRFRHRLRGIESEWINDGTVHAANYSALPPGKYVFELQGATADSPWSEQTASFTLVIRAPWYRTWLAYFIYFLLVSAAIFGYIHYREHVFKLENTATLNQRESERLKAFEIVKNHFFANVAHELRTPLTVISGLSKRILQGTKDTSLQENAEQIIRQGDQLLQLTNQVLDLGRLESQQFQLQLQKGNVIEFIKNHTSALATLAISKGIHLKLESDTGELWTDYDQPQLQKIVNNLISNAIRHTPPGGSIEVKVTTIRDRNEWTLSISDSGEGILPQDMPRVFDRFFQSSNPNSSVGASGIGLTLTRDLVQLMGGSITVDSTPGAGTTFSIRLPIVDQMPHSLKPSAPAIIQEEPPRACLSVDKGIMPLLLLIEDNADIADYLHLCLHPYFKLAIATDGVMGIEKAFALIPDIILTDVAMPLKDGYEVTTTLKNDERTSHIPIAMLTAKTTSSDRLEGRRRGANAYLTKPFDESELLLVLHNLMHLQEQWKHRYAHFLQDQKRLADTDHAQEDVFIEDKFMQKVNEVFEVNYTEDSFNLDRLCRILNMSSSQLDRKMKALTDQSPMHMLRTFRLRKAQALIQKDPQISIKEVCYRTGFKSPAHFSRLYSKEFGVPPSAG